MDGQSEVRGQTSLADFLPEENAEHAPAEGYDAGGNLINPEDTENELTLLAAEINAIKAQVRRSTLSAAVEIGRRLTKARNLAPRGRWLEWLRNNLDYSERTAQNLIACAETYEGDPRALADLSYTQAVALLALPESQRDALIGSGEAASMSTRQLEGEVKRLRAEAAEAQMTIGRLEDAAELVERHRAEAVENLERRIRESEAALESLRKRAATAEERSAADTRRAADAVQRANDADRALVEARRKIEALEAREPEVRTVEAVPDAVAGELERLRALAAKAPSEPVVRLRAGYERLLAEFRAVQGLLEAVRAVDPETAARYAAALRKACEKMAGEIGSRE